MTESPDAFTLGFSSMGAPMMELPELEQLGSDFGMDFLELRTLAGTIGLPDYFKERPEVERNRKLPIRVVSTDLQLAEARQEDIDVFLGFARLADGLGAPYVRVFSGGEWGESFSSQLFDRAAATVTLCRAKMLEANIGCEMLLETHSAFSSSQRCAQLCEQLNEPLFILWDAHHTWKLAGEALDDSWQTIGAKVRHIHYKDSCSVPGGKFPYSYVLPGKGEFPSGDLLRLLRSQTYMGGVSLEWERLWHPELPDLKQALAAFQALI